MSGGRRFEVAPLAAGELVRRLGRVVAVGDQLFADLQNPPVLVPRAAGRVLIDGERIRLLVHGGGQEKRADLVQAVVRHRRDVGIGAIRLVVVDVDAHGQPGAADAVGHRLQVVDAVRKPRVEAKVPCALGEILVGEHDHAKARPLGHGDVLVHVGGRRVAPEIRVILHGRPAVLRAGGHVEVAFDDLHDIEELLLGIGAPEQHGGRPLQGHVPRGERPHLHVLRGRGHPGVRSDVAPAQTNAEPIVIGHIDPRPQIGQPLDAKLHQVDAVDDGVARQRQQLEGQVVRLGGDLVRGRDVGPSEPDRQLVAGQGNRRGREALPAAIDRDLELTIIFLRGDRHLPAAIHRGNRHRRRGPGVLGARGLGREALHHPSAPISNRRSWVWRTTWALACPAKARRTPNAAQVQSPRR